MKRLTNGFFQKDPVTCARSLIGCHLRWHGCEVRIVETEAYDSVGDEACHTWFRPSAREFIASHECGAAYVYLNYGVHWLLNVLVKGGKRSGFVLLRAVEAVDGIEAMRVRRGGRVSDSRLGAGPGCLTRALGIDGSIHGCDLLTLPECGLFEGSAGKVVCGPRIGISRAVDLPWRFGLRDSPALSKVF